VSGAAATSKVDKDSGVQITVVSRSDVMKMRPLAVIGLILAVLGLVALVVPSMTFFTSDRVADVGFFTIDISRPHTVVFNPIAGGIMLAVGIGLALAGFRSGST
jgi:hypothetical protein